MIASPLIMVSDDSHVGSGGLLGCCSMQAQISYTITCHETHTEQGRTYRSMALPEL